MTAIRKRITAWLAFILSLVTSAFSWFFLTRVAGIASGVTGVYIIYGLGWALIAGGVCLVAVSEFIRKGLTARG